VRDGMEEGVTSMLGGVGVVIHACRMCWTVRFSLFLYVVLVFATSMDSVQVCMIHAEVRVGVVDTAVCTL